MISKYSWLSQAFGNVNNTMETDDYLADMYSALTPEEQDLYAAVASDNDLLIAAVQFEQAGSLDPIALETVSGMFTIYGQGLNVQQLQQIAAEYPALTVTGDLLAEDQTDIVDAVELSNTPDFTNSVSTITKEAENQNVDFIGSAIKPENSDLVNTLINLLPTISDTRIYDEETFDEGAYISPMATSTFTLGGEGVASAFISDMKNKDELQKTEDQAAKEIAVGGTVTNATATALTGLQKAAEGFRDYKGYNTLLETYLNDGYQGFEDFVTTELNYNTNTGVTPDVVTQFIDDLGDPTTAYYPGDENLTPQLITDLSFAHEEFMQEWNPEGGYGTDVNWVPPTYYSDADRQRTWTEHNKLLQEREAEGGAFASETRGKTLAAATPLTNPTAVNWALVYKNNPQGTLPVGANGVPLGNYDFVPPEGLSQDEKDYLNQQNNEIIQYKENLMGSDIFDPSFGVDVPTLTGQGTTPGLVYGQTISGPTGTSVDPITGELIQQTTTDGTTTDGTATTPAGTTPAGTTPAGTGETGTVETRVDPITGLPAAPMAPGTSFADFVGTMTPEQFRLAAAQATGQADATTYFTPEQQFMQAAMRTTGPSSPLRQAIYGAQNPLLQQYYLSGYGSLPQYGGTGEIRGFQDFLGDFGQGRKIADDSLIKIAEQAARIGAMEDIDYAESLYDPEMSREELNRRRLYRYTYGTGPQADQNRQNLARFLALQRPGGGVYGGVLGRALGSSVDEMATAYAAMRPDQGQDFLSYFLQQSAGRNKPGTAGAGQKPTARD
tara:strand:+ start:946 stop:3288 length:2343 start_codon:yes stop_codon:yes gene_type:complete